MPLCYWGEALLSVAYLINRVPSCSINFKTPFQACWSCCCSNSPNFPSHVFRCVTYVHLPKHQHNKLMPRALKCVFVGYAFHQKGYMCLSLWMLSFMKILCISPSLTFRGSIFRKFNSYTQPWGRCCIIFNQNVCDLDPSGQNFDLSGDTLHNDTISVEVDELDPSGQTLDQSDNEYLESQKTFEIESESLPIDTPN